MVLVLLLPAAATMAITRGPVIAAVAALARRKELILVMAEVPDAAGYRGTSRFVAQLGLALPQFTITEVMISVTVTDAWASDGHDSYALVADLLNDGVIAVTPTSSNDAPHLAALLASRFGAEKLVLTVDNAEDVANAITLCDSPEPWSSN
ncbi:hypothetical protein OHA72_36815 [Dactylosporangium sp. NBC_01737]|uniref:hypothetical protein n=1 Tax=Dactylosporangium sp. NBC_01737 TaxID=2975959 RepID=UPI002E15BF24|nr:hypothetical protein OHA72_36815 [Dactylosporangium sp. NBC_01737]